MRQSLAASIPGPGPMARTDDPENAADPAPATPFLFSSYHIPPTVTTPFLFKTGKVVIFHIFILQPGKTSVMINHNEERRRAVMGMNSCFNAAYLQGPSVSFFVFPGRSLL